MNVLSWLLLILCFLGFFSCLILRDKIKDYQKKYQEVKDNKPEGRLRYEWEMESYSSNKHEKDLMAKIKLLKKILFDIGIVSTSGLIFSVVFGMVFFLNEQNSQAVVETLGKPELVEGAGIHFKAPYISKVVKVDTTVQGFQIGYQKEEDEAEFVEEESLMITSDFNFINTDFYLEYRIVDAMDYLYGTKDPEKILKNVAQAAIRNTIGTCDVDSVITVGKDEIQNKIQELIVQQLVDETGIEVVRISMQDAEPPTKEVQDAFKAVETAKQASISKVNEAKEYQAVQIPAAEANADKYIKDAEATKQERINEAKSEVAVFEAMYEEYKKNPESTKLRLYYENMEELLPNLKVIINSTDEDITNIFVNGTNVTENQANQTK